MKTAAALELLTQLLIQGQRISQIVQRAQSEGREDLTEEEKADVKADLDHSIKRLEQAVA